VLGLLGLNGAGKTTTLQMLCGALAPSDGDIQLCGHDLREAPNAAKRELGYLPDQPPLYPALRVREYLRYCAALHRVPRREQAAKIDAAIAACDLGEVRDKLIGALSKGFRQRVGLAGALVHEPRVLVLDEPTNGLDPVQIHELRELTAHLGKERAVILSTHLMQEVRATCTRVLVLHRGRALCDSPLSDFASGGWLRARFAAQPNREQLLALDGLLEAQIDGESWRLRPASDDDNGIAALARQLANSDFGLLELHRDSDELESRFVALIRAAEQNAEQGAAA
jgi:ABC-2 type transport system ATP-binding protein